MNRALRLLLLPLFVLAVLASGCGVPLPAPELTATAESQLPEEQERSGSEVLSASSGAPSSGSLSLQPASDANESRSVLAPLEKEELAGATATPEEATDEATPEPEATAEPTSDASTPEVPTPTPTPEPEIDTALYPSEALTLVNRFRIENGIPALQFDATLTAAAMAYAEFMATTGFFGHYPPSGSTPAGRIAAAGFEGQYKGEALSAGQPTPAVAASRLLSSSSHAAILANSTAIAAGVGYYYDPNSYYGHYWVVVTANP